MSNSNRRLTMGCLLFSPLHIRDLERVLDNLYQLLYHILEGVIVHQKELNNDSQDLRTG